MDYMMERLKAMKKRLEDIDKILAQGEGDYKTLAALSKERAGLATPVEMYDRIQAMEKSIRDDREMLKDSDADIREMAKADLQELEARLEQTKKDLQLELLPKDENDERNVLMEIRGAAGGDEANIFAGDLFRMYEHYADKKNWKIKVLDSQPTALGGYSLVSFLVEGKGVYSRLKFESGAHRVQRVPVTEANGRIQTSTATVLVMPEIEKVDIEINPADLSIDTYHSSGAGGQNVNKTESAVRITHKPTGIVVSCQVERSQMQNKEMAMNMLRSKLFQLEEKKRQEKMDQIGGVKKDISFSSQIRSYVFCPYTLVKDLRTDYSEANVQAVMDGSLQNFIDAYLRWDFMQQQKAKKNG